MNFPPREVAVFQILKCDRGKQNNPRKSFSIGLDSPDLFYELNQLCLVLIGSLLTGKGFIVSKHGKDHIRFHMTQIFIHSQKALAAGIIIGTVTG